MIRIVYHLPGRLRDPVAMNLARILYRFAGRQIEIARVNLRICFPELSDEETEIRLLKYWQNYFLVIFQIPLLWWASNSKFEANVKFDGLENVEKFQSKGIGVILLYSHCMALDYGGVALSAKREVYGVYNPFKNPLIDWLYRRGRSRFGGKTVARQSSFRGFIRAVSKGSMVVYLCDEDFGTSGSVFAPFFGRQKSSLTMLSRIVRRTGAAVVPVYSWYDIHTGKIVVKLDPALENYPGEDETANATVINAAIEKSIRYFPLQYLWKLKIFNTQPDGGESVYVRPAEIESH